MPKEIAHWIIADRVAAGLPDGRLAEAVRRHPNCARLGAVFHDVGYYSPESEPKRLVALADVLHGARGEDTNEVLRRVGELICDPDDEGPDGEDPDGDPALTAFLVGLLSHVVADRRLHPMVYYFTGNYYDRDPKKRRPAAIAHRRLEALMDLAVAGGVSGVRGFSLRRILRDLETPAPELMERLAGQLAVGGDSVSGTDLQRALTRFARIQQLVRRPLMVRALGLPLRLAPESRADLFSLTYFHELEGYLDLLAHPLSYRNPVTGEPHVETLSAALDAIVEECIRSCAGLPASSRELGHGESLEMGVVSMAAEATHFHPFVQDRLVRDGADAKIAAFEMLRPGPGS